MALQKELSIDEIRADTAAQPREFMSTDKVEEYADLMKSGVDFPGPVVFFDGSVHWLADGFHRVQAARSAGLVSFCCIVKEGTQRDAVLYSCGANAKHGIQRTNEDKRRAAMKMLQDDEWKTWSARDIAKQCHVTHTFVNKLREQMTSPDTGNVSSMDPPPSKSAKRTFIHPKTGRPTQMKTGGIGKRNRAAKPEKGTSARPEATLTPTESAEAAATISQADSLIVPASETEGFMRERPASGVRTFAVFCSANSATSVAVSILPNEVEEIRFSAARIYEWLDQFALAMDRVEGPKTARGRQKGPQRPGKSSVRQPTLSTNTSPESPDLFESFDR
jgi:ParB/Sulfiredoxin domain